MPTLNRRHTLQLAGAAMLTAAVPVRTALAAADAAGLISTLTDQLGVTRPQAEGGAGALFGLAKQRMAPNQFSQVEQQVPGIGSLMQSAPSTPQGGEQAGGLGGLAAGALGGLGGQGALGGAAGGLGALAPLAGTFSSLGLSPEMAGRFLPIVLQYLNGNGAGSAAGLLQSALRG